MYKDIIWGFNSSVNTQRQTHRGYLPHVEVARGQKRCVRDVLHAEGRRFTGVTRWPVNHTHTHTRTLLYRLSARESLCLINM